MDPRVHEFPPGSGLPEFGVAVDVLPGLRCFLIPDSDTWRAVFARYDPSTGQALDSFEYHLRATNDDEAPAWGLIAVHAMLSSTVASIQAQLDSDPAHRGRAFLDTAQQRLDKVEALIPRL